MSMRYQAAILTASYIPLKTPDAPTIGVASAVTGTSISVAFTAPSNVGGGAITSYYAIATDTLSGAAFSGSGASSPITITGLTNTRSYTVRVAAVNAFGNSPLSAASNSVSLNLEYYIVAGSYSFVVPSGVTSVSAAAIGGGGGAYGDTSNAGAGGGGGAFRYVNNISVTPGATITVTVGAAGTSGLSTSNGGPSSFGSSVVANGGGRATGGSTNYGAGGTGGTGSGGDGGRGGDSGGSYGGGGTGGGGGGAAGGFSSAGGRGGDATGGNAPYNQGNNGSSSGGSGGFGGGSAGWVGGGVAFQTSLRASTTAFGQPNMPLGAQSVTGSSGYYGGGGGGAAQGQPARAAQGGAVAVIWGGQIFS